jgi:hypothetical protein
MTTSDSRAHRWKLSELRQLRTEKQRAVSVSGRRLFHIVRGNMEGRRRALVKQGMGVLNEILQNQALRRN